MLASIPFHTLNALKELTVTVARISIISMVDCKLLRDLIINKTNDYISDIALCRLFDLEPSKFSPSLYTLNILSKYCGYKDWPDFIANGNNYNFPDFKRDGS